MRTPIRDVDFNVIVGTILRSTNVASRELADTSLRSQLTLVKSKTDAVRVVRSQIAVAAVSAIGSPAELAFEQPLVRAFVVIHRHRLAGTNLGALLTESGDDCSQRLLEIADAHPEVRFHGSALEQALVDAIRVHGDHIVDDTKPPWRMHWGPSTAAAWALMFFVSVFALGDLTDNDEAEKNEYDEAVEHFERTKNIKPLKLD